MKRVQWIYIGYGTLGAVLLLSRIRALVAVLRSAELSLDAVRIVLIGLGGILLIALAVISLLNPNWKLGLNAVDTRWHLYGIWTAVMLAVLGVVL